MRSWSSDVNSFPELDHQLEFGPTYSYEYDTRATYGANITGWGTNDPLNATWWHLVTERELMHSRVIGFAHRRYRNGDKPIIGDCE